MYHGPIFIMAPFWCSTDLSLFDKGRAISTIRAYRLAILHYMQRFSQVMKMGLDFPPHILPVCVAPLNWLSVTTLVRAWSLPHVLDSPA